MVLSCVVIGASHAAAEFVSTLRREGWDGEITVFGEELYLPYHRPPLSKTFLLENQTPDDILIRNSDLYDRLSVNFRLGRQVSKIDRAKKQIILGDGVKVGYDKLAICTGSRVRKLDVNGGEVRGIHYLRTVDDVKSIQASIKTRGKAIIIGGGYIGLEMAASLKKIGMKVTLLELSSRLLERVAASELAEFFARVHGEEGIEIKCNKSVSSFESTDGRVKAVACSDGSVYDADLVVVGVGILPNVELAEDAGLRIQNGIVVDQYSRTSDPDIVAAGDCTNHPNELLDCRLRLESVPNAVEQAKSAAASICGKKRVYASIPWFWSDQYDLKLQIVGINRGYDEIVLRGDYKSNRSFVLFYFRHGQLIAADCVNRPKEFMVVKQILSKRLRLDISLLSDESIPPREFIVG